MGRVQSLVSGIPSFLLGSCEMVPTAGVYVVVYMYVTFV